MPRKGKKASKKDDTKDKAQNQKRFVVASAQKKKQKASKNNGISESEPEPVQVRSAPDEQEEQVEVEKNGESEVSVSETSDTKEQNHKSDDEVENRESDQARTTASSPEEEQNEELPPATSTNHQNSSSPPASPIAVTEKPSEKKPEITIVETGHREKVTVDENAEHSEEEKKPTDSPSTSGDEDEDEEESEPETKPDQPIDLSETANSNFKRNPPYSTYVPLRTKLAKHFAAYFPSISSSFPSSPIQSITSTVSTSFNEVYTSLSVHANSLRSRARQILSSSPSTSPSETFSEEESGRSSTFALPSWFSNLVVHLKFLFLALFYLHLGLWALVSLLLIGINICSFFFGPWAVFPIGGWGVGLYIHLIATSYLLQVSGASTKELSWVENPLSRAFGQVKGLTHTAREVATHKYQDLCQSWRCQGARA